jgi:endonuclease YncB( thermonuclease family)
LAISTLSKKASLVGAFFVCALLGQPVPAACPLPHDAVPAQVRSVVDGDTLRLADGRSVRLIGINAPELAHDGRVAEPFGERARQRLVQLVQRSGERIRLQPGVQPQDHYGRTLASVFDLDGRNLEAQLLAEGLAYQVAIAPNTPLVDCQRAAERQAREAGLGLWRRPAWRSPDELKQSGFALVHARVARVARNRGGLWLETDGPLVVHIAPQDLDRFDLAALQSSVGRMIEARGWVVDRARREGRREGRARWSLTLTHPLMLSLL